MFERYSKQARRAIFFARSEAIHRRAPFISTAHLLLGVACEEDSRAVIASSLKENLVAICALLNMPHRPCSDVPYLHQLNIKLDQDAKKALAFAALESDPDGRKEIDTDHLLRGLLRFPNDASHALNSVSIDLSGTRAASCRLRGEPQSPEITRAISETIRPALRSALLKLAIIGIVGILVVLILHWIN